MDNYKPISTSETNDLIKKSQAGDIEATDTLVNGNFPLIKAIVKTYLNKGVDYEDLYQIGCVGFLKAVKNFNPEFDVKFSTYAVPMISGEIKRFLRDDGDIKISRSIKTLSIKIKNYVEQVKNNGLKTPTIKEISEHFGAYEEDVIIAMDSNQQLISLQAKIDEDDPTSQNVLDKLIVDDKNEDIIEKLILKEEISKLSDKEKQIIIMRYYRGKTQSEVAELLDISQVQVSRIESKIIKQLREKMITK